MPRVADPPRDLDVLFAGVGVGELAAPRRLVTGDGSLERVGPSLASLEIAPGRVLLVADPVLVRVGALTAAETSLRGAGFDTLVYDRVAGEPDLAAVELAVAAARAEAQVAVVGVGGGSTMDLAKLAACLATNEGAADDYVLGRRTIERPPLPFALVPTTAGTGAEATKNAIVTHGGRKVVVGSPLLSPTLALLDPLLTLSCPPPVTAASGLDALAHAVEAVLSTWATPLTVLNALAAVRTIAERLPDAVADGADLPARRAMVSAAYLAGLAINASMLLGHSLAYAVAARTHLPHGVTTAMALPYCVAYVAPVARAQVRLLAREAGTDERAFVPWLRDLAVSLGVPGSLAEVGIPRDELPAMVEECLVHYPRPNSPLAFDRGRLLVLCERFHEGDIGGVVEAMA